MLKTGSTIIYPHYGAGKIVDEETIERDGEKQDYFIVEIFLRDLRIKVPKEREENGDFRELVSKRNLLKRLREVRDHILDEKYEEGVVPKVPRAELEAMEVYIKEGSLDHTMEALARLHAKFLQRDMNIGEKRVYDVAKEFCIGELIGIYDFNEEEAKKKLQDYLPNYIPNLMDEEEEEEEEEEDEEEEEEEEEEKDE